MSLTFLPFLLFFFFPPSHLLSSPFYSLSLLVVAQIRGHIAGSSPPLPTTVRAVHFYREKISALSSLVDSRRICLGLFLIRGPICCCSKCDCNAEINTSKSMRVRSALQKCLKLSRLRRQEPKQAIGREGEKTNLVAPDLSAAQYARMPWTPPSEI